MDLLKTHMNLKMSPVTSEMIEKFRDECSTLYPLAAVFYDKATLENHLNVILNETSSVKSIEDDSSKTQGTKKFHSANDDEVDTLVNKLDDLSVNDQSNSNENEGQANKVNGHLGTNNKASKQKRKRAGGCIGNADDAKRNMEVPARI